MKLGNRDSTVVKRNRDHSNSYKGKHVTGAGLQFRGLVHYPRIWKHDSLQTGTVLEKELSVLQFGRQQAGREGNTSSNKATPTPTRPHILILPPPTGL